MQNTSIKGGAGLGLGPYGIGIGNQAGIPLTPGSIVPIGTTSMSGTFDTAQFGRSQLWPWNEFAPGLSDEDKKMIISFKSRHPDYDDLAPEIELILQRRPALLNTALFVSLIYDMAKTLNETITNFTKTEKVEAIIDGQT